MEEKPAIRLLMFRLESKRAIAQSNLRTAKALARKGLHEKAAQYFSSWSGVLHQCKQLRRRIADETGTTSTTC